MSLPPVTRAMPHSCSTCPIERSFCPLPEDLRSVFEGLKTHAALAKGEAAFHEADPCHSVYIVCTGSLKLVTASSEGRVLLLRFAGPGSLLGAAEAVLGHAPYECSAIAAEPSTLAVIPSETFMRFVATYPESGTRLNIALSEQYKASQRETKFLAFGETSTARLARLLLEWSSERGEVREGSVCIPSHVTHSELAQAIGSTRETVTRILGRLHHRGILERTPDEFVIHSSDELTRLATDSLTHRAL
jgi:CRP/FNR family cyclic AMP-dependent transcriptional regulator